MNIKRISLIFMIIILSIVFSINAAATCGGAMSEAESYYSVYNVKIDILAAGPKYPDVGQSEISEVDSAWSHSTGKTASNTSKNDFGYAITYVMENGTICNLYAESVPDNFGIWNTDIVINDGRVVVTGVDGDDQSAWNLIYSKYKGVIVGIAGLGTITCVLAFVIFFMKMGATSGNPAERSKCLTMLLFTGAGAAGLGAVTLIFGFFWNLI